MAKSILATIAHPTTRADGDPLTVAEIKHVIIEMRAEAATTWTPVGQPMLPTQLTRTIQNLPGGGYRVRATWVDTQDRPSVPAEQQITVPTAAPNAGSITLTLV